MKKIFFVFFLLIIAVLLNGCDYSKILKKKGIEHEDSLNINNINEVVSEEIDAFLDRFGWVTTDTKKIDINQNGVDDYIIETIGNGCGSCHLRHLFIIEDHKVIFEYEGNHVNTEDGTILNNRVNIKEAIYSDGDAMCCPSMEKTIEVHCPKLVGVTYCYIENSWINKK